MNHAAAYDPIRQRMLVCLGLARGGAWAFHTPGAVSVRAQIPPRGLALHGARPNPVVGDLVVAFTLPDDQPARLEVFDTAGRRVESREVGSLGGGEHRVALVTAGRLRAGIYVVRLSHGRGSTAVRAAVVR